MACQSIYSYTVNGYSIEEIITDGCWLLGTGCLVLDAGCSIATVTIELSASASTSTSPLFNKF